MVLERLICAHDAPEKMAEEFFDGWHLRTSDPGVATDVQQHGLTGGTALERRDARFHGFKVRVTV